MTIPNGVTSIGQSAFAGCTRLTTVTIPNSVTSIGQSAFLNCSGLTSVTIPNSVTSIHLYAFEGCSGLKKVIVNDVAAWCNIDFRGYDANPLYYAHHLYCDENTEITDLVIPNSVTSIGTYAFCKCSGLTSVNIPNSVTSIGRYAFEGCSGLTSVTIPESVTSIGWYAFNCSGLTSVKVEMESPLSISSSTFSYRANATLYVPKGSKAAYEEANYWKEFKQIVEFPNADVNQDGKVNVVDVVDIARFVVGTPRDTFIEFLADLNSDDDVNVADAVVLVNEIAGDQNFAKAFGAPQAAQDDHLMLAENDDHSLSLSMESQRDFTAFQLELSTNSDADVMGVVLNASRKNGHQLLYNKVGEGRYRVVVLSVANNAFTGANGELLNIQLDGFNTGDVTISNIHFITTNGTDHRFDNLTVQGETTGLNGLTPSPSPQGKGEMYDLSGRRVSVSSATSEHSVLPKGVYIVNGKKIVVK